MSAAVEQLEESYEEAAEVDAEYEYLLKNKDKGITFEEYCRQRGIELWFSPKFKKIDLYNTLQSTFYFLIGP